MTDTPLFQATAPLSDLTKETVSSGNELIQETAQVGADILHEVGSFISEPSQLFQPSKAISTLGGLGKNVADFGVKSVKGTVNEVVDMGKNVGAIRSEPSPDGQGLFQPTKPLETLGTIWAKVIKSWATIAGGIVKAGTDVLKKGIGIFRKRNEEIPPSV